MSIRWLLVGLCSLAVILIVFGTVNARADVVEPGCEPVESWALTIDPDDRWHPDAARQGFWLPAQFEGETFETLFAVPAAEWTLDDVKTVGSLLRSCAKDARKAKRTDAEKAFHRARSFVTGNLRNYIRRTNRASARLDKRVGNLLELPTTPALLQVLAVLRELRAGDNDALRQAQRNLGQIGGQEARTARRIVQSAFRQTPEAYAADPLPQIEDRYQELRIGFLDEAESAIADHPAGSAGLAAIDTALTEIREELGGGLLTEDYAHLEELAAEERAAVRHGILSRAQTQIDGLPVDAGSLGEANAIAVAVSASLDPDSVALLEEQATARQRAIASDLLAAAGATLNSFPETLAGIEALNAHVETTLETLSSYLEAAPIDRFKEEARARRTAIAEIALPEFEGRIAAFPDTPAGQAELQAEEARVSSWEGLPNAIGNRYEQAIAARRNSIETAVAAAAAAHENERQQRIVESTKARIDALPAELRSLSAIPAEVQAASGKGLDPVRLQTLQDHAANRRLALADEILDQAAGELARAEAAQGIEELVKLDNFAKTVMSETQAAATPQALARFEEQTVAMATKLGREMQADFTAYLAGLKPDKEGLNTAAEVGKWVESWRFVDETLRAGYLEAARSRHEGIAASLAAAEERRRSRVLAAGGDPDLVGYTFRDENGMLSLEFVDEERVILASMGMRFGGTYEVVKDDVFVEGPNGSVVFAREGDSLSGMGGLVLQRVQE